MVRLSLVPALTPLYLYVSYYYYYYYTDILDELLAKINGGKLRIYIYLEDLKKPVNHKPGY
jgi:hypothetical protein